MKKIVEVAAAVILRPDGAFLLGRRPPGGFYAGYWEFPGGKVELGETPREALLRELHEELGIRVETAYPWIVREFVYEHAHVRLHFFRVLGWQGELRDLQHDALEWQRAGDVGNGAGVCNVSAGFTCCWACLVAASSSCCQVANSLLALS